METYISMKNSNAGVDPSNPNPIFDSHYHDMSLCI